MNEYMEKLVLDTHILLWYLEGEKLSTKQIEIIDEAKDNNGLFISAISVWEIAMLSSKGKIAFSIGMNELVSNILSIPGLKIIELSIPVLLESTMLPNFDHKDPADRMIVASCRANGAYLMSMDQKIIDYANQGYLKIISTNN